jgi:hypothetical protein
MCVHALNKKITSMQTLVWKMENTSWIYIPTTYSFYIITVTGNLCVFDANWGQDSANIFTGKDLICKLVRCSFNSWWIISSSNNINCTILSVFVFGFHNIYMRTENSSSTAQYKIINNRLIRWITARVLNEKKKYSVCFLLPVKQSVTYLANTLITNTTILNI